jgi:class 3 adenylate cyclase/tetratricopeptide (TPR) repeat protein
MPDLLNTLASYVPALITRRLAADPAPLAAPLAERFTVAVLFADITGFTPLTERLGQRGLTGVEELSRILKDYFGPLTALIAEHGGDVVKFAGDALLAAWIVDFRPLRVNADWPNQQSAFNNPQSLPEATLRAAQCALAVQARLHNYPAAEGVRLSMRLGIGVGEMTLIHIGGVFGRWEFVLTGSAIGDVSLAEKQAQPGEVILSPEAWALAQAACEGDEGRDGGWRLTAIRAPLPPSAAIEPELSPEMEPALRAYLPGAILARLAAGQSGWIAELRRVTVLFINLPGFGQTTTLDESHEAMRELQRAIYRYEGSINKLNVDDKGVTLVAALGLPPLAHEDDSVRGVLVALDVHAALTRLKRPHAIGVTTGRIFCGSVGGERRREYAIHADSVNLAARLMQAVASDLRSSLRGIPEGLIPILCDDATYHTAQGRINFEPLPAITVKGKAAPVAVYRPLGEKKAAVRVQTEIVGRERERAILTEAMQTLLRGDTAGVVVVEGEPGIGKSRLVAEVRRQAHEMGVVTFAGAGDAVEKTAAYHGWRGVFAELFGLESIPDAEARRQRVIQSLGPEWREQAPLLNDVLSLDLAPTDLTQQLIGEVRADNTRQLLVTVLQAAVAQAPKVILLEDTHWLDSASWALALNVSQRVHPILLVVATRPLPEPLPPEYAKLLAQPNTIRLQLQPLPDDDALTLVCHRLGVTGLPDSVAALIREKAEGNPFFSEELAYALRDSGLIQVTGDECRVTAGVDLKTVTFPDTVQGVITSRIDRLSPPQQLALKVASVIGRMFIFRILHAIYPIQADKARLHDYLSTLETLDLTPLDTPEPDLTYIFKHIITQEVAYNLMLFAQRRELHRAVAEWYERVHADDLSLYYPLLAYHWSKAEDRANALTYLEKAGEQALTNYANQEAVSFLSEAARLADDVQPPVSVLRRARWERQMSEANLKLGRHPESREHSQRALALLSRPLPAGRGGRMFGLLAQLATQVARRLFRPSATRTGTDLPESTATRLEIARVYFVLGELAYYDNDVVLGLSLMLGIINLMEADGPSTELANAYAGLSLVGAHLGQAGLLELYSRLAQAAAQHVGKTETQAFVLQVISAAQLRMGRWAECEAGANQAAAIYARLGDRRRWEECLNYLAEVAAVRGKFARWAELLSEAIASARQRGDIQSALLVLVELVSVRLVLGQPAQALADIQTIFNLLKQEAHPDFERLACARLAQAHLRQGDLPLATQALERGLSLTNEAPPALIFAVGSAALASAALEVWQARGQPATERQSLAQVLRKLCANARHDSRWIAQPLLWRLRGWEARLSDNPPQARRLWRKSLAEAERLQIPYETALAHYEIGQHASGDVRRRHLTHAVEIFERLGAAYDLERTQAAMDAV